jgi:mersacidin/lichenicidin family type 2 lantibiotic
LGVKTFDIIRAWKDVRYRNSLSAEERAVVPENPAGSIELDEEELDAAVGGLDEPASTKPVFSAGCCSKYKKPKTGEIDDIEPVDDESCKS